MPVFANCEFPLLPDSDAVETMHAAVSAGQPFSFIRLNDGEAVVLSIDDDTWLQDLAYLHGHWGAEGVTMGAIAEVQRDLYAAVYGADLIGIRDDIVGVSLPDGLLHKPPRDIRDTVTSTFKLREGESDNLSTIGARRLALLHRVLRRVDWSQDQRFCSVWVHWEMLATGVLSRILEEVTEVGLITSRPEIGPLLAQRFDVNVSTLIVPDKFSEAKHSGEHVPSRYQTIRSEFTFPKGSLVLVGAGIPGKVYCQWAKELGCVALDIGSVFDAWVGKASRPRILESRFGAAGGNRVPRELQLHPTNSSTGRLLMPRWKASGVAD